MIATERVKRNTNAASAGSMFARESGSASRFAGTTEAQASYTPVRPSTPSARTTPGHLIDPTCSVLLYAKTRYGQIAHGSPVVAERSSSVTPRRGAPHRPHGMTPASASPRVRGKARGHYHGRGQSISDIGARFTGSGRFEADTESRSAYAQPRVQVYCRLVAWGLCCCGLTVALCITCSATHANRGVSGAAHSQREHSGRVTGSDHTSDDQRCCLHAQVSEAYAAPQTSSR